ncbi:ARS-binding protein 2 [Pseudocercospora fuligena]|uniref:ARS-binding protein 2 n=1 Tax=Pseudocercospora fuligena TaxID=685502 RepID=A0A8H6RUA1_9PEZI|nr:ARS-binding protein 2 [Pseudocercospora fuligena]
MFRHQSNSEQQYHHVDGSANSQAFTAPVYGIDPNLHSSQHLHPGVRTPISRTSSHKRHSSADTMGAMQPPAGTSPRVNSASPGRTHASGFQPSDRQLPSRDLSASTITQAFVDYILYCNPNFPLDVDTTTLRTNFESPPKSDSKDFEVFKLFELIKKFDAKEIKTWGQLALDLGVEAPDLSKGQSVQKVQQYSVRLKRWMRAMHIDSFFEYLLGKQHAYFTDIPPPSEPYPASGRDGVMAEEDLAIRALDPSFRPKRGRRRNSETEQEENADSESANKQPKLIESAAAYSANPMSALPMSAHPDSYHDPWAVASAVTPQSFAPWSARAPSSAVPASANSHLRWQLGQSHAPGTPHPMSAMSTSMSAHIDAAFDGEPKSAVTPSSRKRRRHGPAVSSAWPSTSAPGAKPRGRPPASRNTQDGPFNTFPADPGNDKKSVGGMLEDRQPSVEQPSLQIPQPGFQSSGEGRPARLSLQVPQHTGGPVRLATPPALQVNGEARELETRSDSDDPTRSFGPALQHAQPADRPAFSTRRPDSGFSFEALKRALTSDLLRADLSGRQHRLSGDEAKRLADSMLERLNVPRAESGTPQDDIARLTAASWLGVGDQANVPLGPAAGHGKKINVTRFRTDADGYEEITYDQNQEGVREVFDIFWHVSMGGCIGAFEMKGLRLAPPNAALLPSETTETTHDLMLRKSIEAMYKLDKDGWVENSMREIAHSAASTRPVGEDHIDWRSKCKAMEFAANVAKGEVDRLKKRMLERIIEAVL